MRLRELVLPAFTGEKRFEFEWEGRKVEVVVRKLTWGEYNKLIAESSTVVATAGVPQVRVDAVKFREKMFVAAVKELRIDGQQFTVSEELARSLPYDLAERIMQLVEQVNPLAERS